MPPAIRVENVSKCYRVHHERRGRLGYRTLREDLVQLCTAPIRRLRRLLYPAHANGTGPVDEDFSALRDVSFDVQPGEVVGIIGRNGAGKSTLLKIVSRITSPTAGRVTLHGRVGSLLEVGTGFHHELTGQENIFLNGAILGMTRREIQRKFDEIVDFSGVEQFLDTPVKHYSSGMRVRLAFSVAAHLEPEILLIDEVLAVGDAAFQRKCLGKMNEAGRSGRTILFVSHNLAAVEGLCQRGVVLQQGALHWQGTAAEAIRIYHQSLRENPGTDGGCFRPSAAPESPSGFQLLEIAITSESEPSAVGFPTGAPLEFHLRCLARQPVQHALYTIRVHKLGVGTIAVLSTQVSGAQLPESVEGEYTVTCSTKDLLLAPGDYTVSVRVKAGGTRLCRLDDVACFTILSTDFFGTGRRPELGQACVVCRPQWELRQTP